MQTTIYLPSNIKVEAKRLKINISWVCQEALKKEIARRQEEERLWLAVKSGKMY